MRVVNSANLWDNRREAVSRPWYTVAFYLAVILVAAVGLLAAMELKPANKNAVTSVSKPITPTQTGLPQTLALTINQLLPEQDNPSNSLLRILATPPPPPTPNCAVAACIALTFDDGPNPGSTPIILEALEKEQVNATFFLIGIKVAANNNIMQRMYTDGNDIGNHSWNHADLTKLSRAQLDQQINQTQSAITSLGIPAPRLFRPPYGSFTKAMLPTVHMPVILWNVDPKDWHEIDAKRVVSVVEAQARPGALIVMHDKPVTAAAVAQIIHDLKPRFRFVTVTELLNLAPDAHGIFVGR